MVTAAVLEHTDLDIDDSEGLPSELEGERPPPEETKPRIPRPSTVEQIQNRFDKAKAKITRKPRARTAKPRRPRVPVDGAISALWGILAGVVKPVDPHVATVLGFQAPVVGAVLEDHVKNTVIDRMLQPIARTEQSGELIMGIVGPPLLVGVISRKPERAPLLLPLLRRSMIVWLKIAGPKIEAALKEEAEYAEEFGATVDTLIMQIFPELFEKADDSQ